MYGEYMEPSIGGHINPLRASLAISLVKTDNGYIVDLREVPPQKKQKPVHQESPFAGKSPDEIIDQMIDGCGAVLRTLRQAETEEEWKGSEDREKVRMAFKALFPSLAQQAFDMSHVEEIPQPRHEQKVFESKESMMKYLNENLPTT
jgi:hypothetical protein